MSPLVLILDDSELILEMLDMVCQQAGFRTVTCTDMASVPAAIGGETPAVIVSDLNLPDLDGANPVDALRALDGLASVPIVIVSGLKAEPLANQADAIGADAWVSKDAGMPAVQAQLPGLLDDLSAQ